LDAEQIRDSILSISGRLDYGLGGKTVPLRNRQFVFNHTSVDHTKYDSLRRAIYLPVIRNNIYAFFEQFDFPDPTMPTGRRNSTVVAPQALLMMNSQLVMQSATEFATRILAESGDESHRVRLAYTLAFGRPSSEVEIGRAHAFLEAATAAGRTDAAAVSGEVERDAWALFCQALFASNEFIYLR
jgi:hypothetical protein